MALHFLTVKNPYSHQYLMNCKSFKTAAYSEMQSTLVAFTKIIYVDSSFNLCTFPAFSEYNNYYSAQDELH